jgi:hypothetical protein
VIFTDHRESIPVPTQGRPVAATEGELKLEKKTITKLCFWISVLLFSFVIDIFPAQTKKSISKSQTRFEIAELHIEQKKHQTISGCRTSY